MHSLSLSSSPPQQGRQLGWSGTNGYWHRTEWMATEYSIGMCVYVCVRVCVCVCVRVCACVLVRACMRVNQLINQSATSVSNHALVLSFSLSSTARASVRTELNSVNRCYLLKKPYSCRLLILPAELIRCTRLSYLAKLAIWRIGLEMH